MKYRALKTDYVEALLRGRLQSKITASDAEKQYLAAEKLRDQGKFIEAGKAFVQLREQSPTSPWADAAGFRIGQCLLGLNRTQRALDHWAGFVKASPDGPWRGQARVALIDLALETNFDLATAAEHSLAATASLAKVLSAPSPRMGEGRGEGGSLPRPLGEGRGEGLRSWQDAAFDIRLRHGTVSLIDGRAEAAALAFQQAKSALPSAPDKSPEERKRLAEQLDRLIAAAQQKTSVIPDEAAREKSPLRIILSLGQINLLLDRPDAAQKFFTAGLTDTSRKSTPAERSYAALGLARAYAGLASQSADKKKAGKSPDVRLEVAKSLYQRSVKEHPAGPWHDETLHELALLIERLAALRNPLPRPSGESRAEGSSSPSPRMGEGRGEGSPAPTDAQRLQQSKSLAAARSESVPSWTDLAKKFPASPFAAQALYHAGLIHAENEQPDDAIKSFAALVKSFPASPYTGDAQIRLIDVKLEQQFDLPAAAALSAAAVTWYETPAAALPHPLGEALASSPSPRMGEGRGEGTAPTTRSAIASKPVTTSTSAPA